ncbi:MAG: 7-cyano-7-deazaguanine synthase [Candidatus Woesearchaeota archaeon]
MNKVVVLLSGGIDSPVAAAMFLKKGVEAVLVHFYNQTPQQEGVKGKIQKLAEQLTKYGKVKLLMIPFGEIQREIIKTVPADYRMIVYRRMMFRIADKIREKERAEALVTGDSVGQVASQTLENLRTIYSATKSTVLHPLIGKDKREIMDLAKELGTLDISNRPYEDCCSFMIARHPATKSRIEEIEQFEKNIDVNNLIESAISQLE